MTMTRSPREPQARGGEHALLSDQIRNALTDEIASGALAAGDALDEQEVADRFDASRTPVREALRQLAANGLVEMRPRRGVLVTRLTPEQITDMFETAAEIETMCVRLATYRIAPLERGRLLDMRETSRGLVLAGDIGGYDAFNSRFHEAICRAAHNGFMAERALAVRARLRAFRRTQLRYMDRIVRSREEHDAIMVAIAQGGGEEAARRMRAHMLNAAGAIGNHIEEHATVG